MGVQISFSQETAQYVLSNVFIVYHLHPIPSCPFHAFIHIDCLLPHQIGRDPFNAFEADLVKKPTKKPLLGQWDSKVHDLVKGLRTGGSPINPQVMASAIICVLSTRAPWQLKSNGGPIDPMSRSLRASMYRRYNMRRRAVTSSRKNLTADELLRKRKEFSRGVKRWVREYDIPDALVINWDETSLPVMPTTDFTMAVRGARTVKIAGHDDKRAVTGLVGVARDGTMLPLQIIYTGTTVQCHPKASSATVFRSSWDIWHTPSHWSNVKTKERYVRLVILPYINAVRARFGLAVGEDYALVTFDHHTSNIHCEEMFKLFGENRILWQLVPASTTDQCQVNRSCSF